MKIKGDREEKHAKKSDRKSYEIRLRNLQRKNRKLDQKRKRDNKIIK